jgi:hypothetical protein
MAYSPNIDYGLEIARGHIAGLKGILIPGRKDGITFGGDFQDITQTGNTALPRPAGANIEIISTDTDDDGDIGGPPEGTGIQTVEIEYLDSSGDEARASFTLNGTTAVNIGSAVHDIQWMHSTAVGTGGVAAGDIKVRDVSTGAIVYEQISEGGNQSLSARYKVPNGKTAYITGWHVSAVSREIDFRLRADVNRATREIQSGVFNFQDVMVLDDVASGQIPFFVPLKCPQLSTIKVAALSFVGNGDGGCQFEMILVDD